MLSLIESNFFANGAFEVKQCKLLTNDIVDRHAIMVCYVYITTQNADISVP